MPQKTYIVVREFFSSDVDTTPCPGFDFTVWPSLKIQNSQAQLRQDFIIIDYVQQKCIVHRNNR